MKITEKYEQKRNSINLNKIGILGISFMLILFVFCQPIFSQDSNPASGFLWLEKELEQSRYSGFQKRMIITASQELLELDANFAELKKVLTTSINNNFDAYNIKKILEVLIEAKKKGISEKSLISKFKEGLAKKIDEPLIVQAIMREAENLEIATNLLKDYRLEEDTEEHDVVVESLAEGLNNGVPQDSLSEVLSRSVKQGKNTQEIIEVSTELGNLSLRAYEFGFSEDEVNEVFQRAVSNRSDTEGICEDIQDMLIGAMAAKINMASGKSSSGNGQSTSSSDITSSEGNAEENSSSTDITPSSDSGTSSGPTDADDKPDDDKPDDDDTSSPPEN